MSLVLALLQAGYPDAALTELDRAAERAPRELRGQVLVQRALIHIRVGRFEEALDDSRRALPLLRRAGDRLNEARLLSNRGVLHAYRSELALAETDLNKALHLYGLLESEIAAAQVLHNLGYVSALQGDVPAALRRYDQAARHFAERGWALRRRRSIEPSCCCPRGCSLKLGGRSRSAWRRWRRPVLRSTWLRPDCC